MVSKVEVLSGALPSLSNQISLFQINLSLHVPVIIHVLYPASFHYMLHPENQIR